MTTTTTNDAVIIDISDHVVRYAHDQGHLKACRDRIDWSEMRTSCGADITDLSEERVTETSKQVTNNTTKLETIIKLTNNSSTKINNHHNFVSNFGDYDVTVEVELADEYRSCSDVSFRLNRTLACDATRPNCKQNKTHLAPLNIRKEGYQHLIHLPGNKWRNMDEDHKSWSGDRLKLVIGAGCRKALQVDEVTVKRCGVFTAIYHLSGYAAVNVWGKKVRLPITDILDHHEKGLHRRESNKTTKEEKKITSQQQDIIEYKLHGEYKIKTTKYQIKLQQTNSPFKIISLQIDKVKCICDVIELPYFNDDDDTDVKLMTRVDIATVVIKWNQIRKSLQREDAYTNSDDEVWKSLLNLQHPVVSEVANNIQQQCSLQLPIDKITLTILVWMEHSTDLHTYSQTNDNVITATTSSREVIDVLHRIGVPVSAFDFLWAAEKPQQSRCYCPEHNYRQEENIKNSTHKKLTKLGKNKINKPLPDRVIMRFINEWEAAEGWLTTALYCGLDAGNISNLACDELATNFNDLQAKRLTIFRLWRMKLRSKLRRHCTTFDMCLLLNSMSIHEKYYEFCWTGAETTP